MSKPLEGVKVLDFTQFFAGPYCTLMLEEMGAEIIKFENPPFGDASRSSATIADGANTNYATKNRGKKSVLMNLKDDRQKQLFLKMVETADVVIENYKPGTMEKFGITYDLLKSINPAIVYTSISGFGQDGPFRDHTALDGVIQAIAGATGNSLLETAIGALTSGALTSNTASEKKTVSIKVTESEKTLLQLYRDADNDTKKKVVKLLKNDGNDNDLLSGLLGGLLNSLK